jgi:hypothetical protein
MILLPKLEDASNPSLMRNIALSLVEARIFVSLAVGRLHFNLLQRLCFLSNLLL